MNTPTDQNPQPPVTQPPVKQMRWLGFFMFIGGGALAYISIISPLLAASRHEDDVSISLKAVVLTPALLVIGLILFCVGNERAGQLLGTKKKPKVIGIVICLVILGIGILLYQWLKSKLRAYGYSF